MNTTLTLNNIEGTSTHTFSNDNLKKALRRVLLDNCIDIPVEKMKLSQWRCGGNEFRLKVKNNLPGVKFSVGLNYYDYQYPGNVPHSSCLVMEMEEDIIRKWGMKRKGLNDYTI